MEELRSVLPDCKLEPYKISNNKRLNTCFFKLETDNTSNDILAKIRDSALSFVDFIMPVDAIIDTVNLIEYQKVRDLISKIMETYKYLSFKIEVKNIDFRIDKTAKSIEIELGSDIEENGYEVNFLDPKVVIYVILLNSSVIIGHIDTEIQKDYILDSFRQANKENTSYINRAEFKIKEAIEFFNINMNKHKLCLDIGASPGGWTHYLSQNGIRVVAVDNALLNYKMISRNKQVLVLVNKVDLTQIQNIIMEGDLSKNVSVERINNENIKFDNYDIIHIKTNMDQNNKNELLKKFGYFDILIIDTNTDPLQSTAIANSLVELLCPKASLIMTIKFMTKNFSKHIHTVETELSKNYICVKLKKLSHNRRELTVYGIRTEELKGFTT